MTILLADPRVSAVPVHECGEPLVRLPHELAPLGALVRRSLADRLVLAARTLPPELRLRVVEGHRSPRAQRAIIDRYTAEVRAAHPDADEERVRVLTSRFVAPLDVAPHVAGAAVDLTLADATGRELDLGTPIDATPEQSGGACFFAAPVPPTARAHRDLLALALTTVGLVNYPTEWWHWSFGDRYWALVTGAPAALFGPVDANRSERAA